MCNRLYYRDRRHWSAFLQNTWVRPEDVHHYEPWFGEMKLAPRMHDNPRRVIRAYAEGKFHGNLPDIFEPGHGAIFAPFVFANDRFGDDWFKRITACRRAEETDAVCREVLDRVLVDFSDERHAQADPPDPHSQDREET